jgi:hypothetical protein
MSDFESVPPAVLVDAVEKLVAKMNDAELASSLRSGVATMQPAGVHALVASIFDAFRERGESSEDAAEGANTDLADLSIAEPLAVAALIEYASVNAGLLKDALVFLAERHAEQLGALPESLRRAITERLQAPHP